MTYELDDTLLQTKMDDFDFDNPPIEPVQLAKDLSELMLSKNGIGLAANQVNLPHKVCVIRGNPIIAMYNPRIVDYSGNQVYMEEGCLSYPNLIVKIKRPEKIRIRFAYPNGDIHTEQYTGMTARIMQHEVDHLDGIVFYSRANRYHRDKGFKDWKKMNAKK